MAAFLRWNTWEQRGCSFAGSEASPGAFGLLSPYCSLRSAQLGVISTFLCYSLFRKVFTLFSRGTHEARSILDRNKNPATTFLQACWVPWQCTQGLIIHQSRWLLFYLLGQRERVSFGTCLKLLPKIHRVTGGFSSADSREQHRTASAAEGGTWLAWFGQPGRLDHLDLCRPKH